MSKLQMLYFNDDGTTIWNSVNCADVCFVHILYACMTCQIKCDDEGFNHAELGVNATYLLLIIS